MLKKVLQWALLAFVLWWIVTQPTGAAAFARSAGSWLATAATGAGHFLSALTR